MRIGAVGAMVHNPVQMVHVHWCTTLVHNPTPKGVEVVMCTRGEVCTFGGAVAPASAPAMKKIRRLLKRG